MCNTRSIIDPGGLLYGKHGKIVDPLGVTKTAIGDPTGHIRKERAKVKAENAVFTRSGITTPTYSRAPATALGGSAAAPGGRLLGG